MPEVANVTLRSTFSFNKTKENESTESFSHFGRGCHLISVDA